jgi:hypothetical protein
MMEVGEGWRRKKDDEGRKERKIGRSEDPDIYMMLEGMLLGES